MKETASPPNDLPHARDGAANYQISPIKAWAGHQLHQKLLHAKKEMISHRTGLKSLRCALGCSSKSKSSQIGLIMKYMLCLHVRGPPKKSFRVLSQYMSIRPTHL